MIRLLLAIAIYAGIILGLSYQLTYGQTAGCYKIDRFGELCIPGTGEIFVEEAQDQSPTMEWLKKNYPTQMGYCCDHEHCKPVSQWGRLEFTGKSWRLRKHDGGYFFGEIEPESRYVFRGPLGLTPEPWACVYREEFRCLLWSEGQ